MSAGRWEEAIRLLEHSHALDPRNEEPLLDLFELLHDGRAATPKPAASPNAASPCARTPSTGNPLWRPARWTNAPTPAPALALYAPLPPGHEPSADATSARFFVLWRTRDLDGAARVLAGSPASRWPTEDFLLLPRAYFEGFLAR